jgi:hypothetical protein
MGTIAINIYSFVDHHPVDYVEVPLIVDKVLSACLTGIAFIFAIPLTMLLSVHFKNFATNRTTNERFSKTSTEAKNDSISTISFDNRHRTCFGNFQDMCCNSHPSLRNTEEKLKNSTLDASYFDIMEKLNTQIE